MSNLIIDKTFETDDNDDADYDLLERVLRLFRKEIIEGLIRNYGDDKEYWENEYEGGIDAWWGPGSVGLYELGMCFRVTYGGTDNLQEVRVECFAGKP